MDQIDQDNLVRILGRAWTSEVLWFCAQRELSNLENLLWFTPYLGERKVLLEQLCRHLEKSLLPLKKEEN